MIIPLTLSGIYMPPDNLDSTLKKGTEIKWCSGSCNNLDCDDDKVPCPCKCHGEGEPDIDAQIKDANL